MTDKSLYLTGRSYPENAVGFYKPIMDMVNEVDKYEDFHVEMDLEYMNTSSTKAILYILQNITKKTKNEVLMTWYIDEGDDSMEDLCEQMKSMISNLKMKKIIK
jgi:hypothetical protein